MYLYLQCIVMEPEVKEYLRRIMYTVFIGFTWMALNSTFGIMFDFAFIHGSISAGNIIFYTWFLASFAGMLVFFIKLWRKPAA